MDFRLFYSVLQRFKYVVAIGFIAACALSFLSFFTLSPSGIHYRQRETWQDTARVLVTAPARGQDTTSLAQVFASLATSDEVTKAAMLRHRIPGVLQADFGYINRTSTALPTISITAVSATPSRAAMLANDAVDALRIFVARQQAETGVPKGSRAKLQTLNTAIPFRAQVATPRSKTPPVVVFVLVLAATGGLALLLENVRPRAPSLPVEVASAPSYLEARRARDQG